MSEETLSAFYTAKNKNYHSRTDILKFLLVPLVFFMRLGIPGKYGQYISTYSNFVPQVFFILFGFFTLVPDDLQRQKKLKRSLRRSFKFFALMFFCFLVLNIIYLAYYHSTPYLLSEHIWRKRTFFDFLVLSVWPLPFGKSIWFVQSLSFAYLFFWLAERFRLQKWYLPIGIILALFALATGEFAAFFGFPYFGYLYIPGGTLTRAIPYMLIGMYLHKHVDTLAKLPRVIYLLLFPVGLLAAILEIEALGRSGKLIYMGHTIGFGIMALSLCCFAIAKPEEKINFLSKHGNNFSKRMYAFCQPVSFATWLLTTFFSPSLAGFIRNYSCFISLMICSIISLLIFLIKRKWYNGKKTDFFRKLRRKIRKKRFKRMRKKYQKKYQKKNLDK